MTLVGLGLRRAWAVLVALIVVLVCSTTAASATAGGHVYDVATIARVDVHEFDTAEAGPTQLSYVREGSASPSVDGRGTSTTPVARSVATEVGAGALDDIGATTVHGAERVAGSGATRGGVLSPGEIVNVRSSEQIFTQSNGAKASCRGLTVSSALWSTVNEV